MPMMKARTPMIRFLVNTGTGDPLSTEVWELCTAEYPTSPARIYLANGEVLDTDIRLGLRPANEDKPMIMRRCTTLEDVELAKTWFGKNGQLSDKDLAMMCIKTELPARWEGNSIVCPSLTGTWRFDVQCETNDYYQASRLFDINPDEIKEYCATLTKRPIG